MITSANVRIACALVSLWTVGTAMAEEGRKVISASGGLCQAGCHDNRYSDRGSSCSTQLSPDLGLDGDGKHFLKDSFYVTIDANPSGGIVDYKVTPQFTPEGSDKPVVIHSKVRCVADNGDTQRTLRFTVHAIEITK